MKWELRRVTVDEAKRLEREGWEAYSAVRDGMVSVRRDTEQVPAAAPLEDESSAVDAAPSEEEVAATPKAESESTEKPTRKRRSKSS